VNTLTESYTDFLRPISGTIPHIINFCFNDWNRKNRIKKLIFHILEEKIMVVNVPTLV